MLPVRWLYLLRRLVLLLGVYFLLRLMFLICNFGLFSGVSFLHVAQAFGYGLRFDFSALVAINFPFILISLLPRRAQPNLIYERLVQGLFLLLNIPFLIINVIDVEFFQFTGRRLTFQRLSLAGDPGVKWATLLLSYWPLLLLGLSLIALLVVLYGKIAINQKPQAKPATVWAWLLSLVLVAPLSILIFRGGFQWRPINQAQAMALGHAGLAQLALNSSFTVLKTYGSKPLVRRHYFDPPDEALQCLRSLADGGEQLLPNEKRRDNIVILILESFSAEYWGAGNGGNRYTTFLDSLAGQSLFFTRNYANGRASIEVMPSVLAGLPSLMEEPFINSAYQSSELLGLGTALGREGYTTSFFHGGRNGTMHFDAFMHLAGFQHYFGLDEYPRREDYDGDWGIYDEPFLQFTVAELSKQKPPFAAAIFTLSSHHPYTIPSKYRGRFKKGTLPIHEAVGYTDYAVEQFFAAARRQPWYTNTLFIITADHTQKLETPEYLNTLGQYRVPLLIFHPHGALPPVDPGRTTQHADIIASILDYLDVQPGRRLLFGKSVFRTGEGRAFLHVNGHYWLVRGPQALEFIPEGASRLYDLSKDPGLKSPLPGESERRAGLEKEAKALVQYYNNGLLDNKLYDRSDHFPPTQ